MKHVSIVYSLQMVSVSLRKPWSRILTKSRLRRNNNLLSVLRLGPCPEVRYKAILAEFDSLLILQRLLESFVDVSRPHQKEQFRPERLTSHKFNPVFPLSVAIESDEQECTNAVGYAGIASKSCFNWSRLNSPFQNIPVLLFQRFPCPTSNLSA